MLPPLSDSNSRESLARTTTTATTTTSTTRPVLYKVFLIVFYFFLGFEVAREIQNTFVLQRSLTVSSFELYTAFLSRLTWVACLFAVVRYFWIVWKYICNTILAAPKRRPLVTLPVFPYMAISTAATLRCCRSSPAYNTKCPICLTEFEENDDVCIGPACGHVFHSECIHKWVAYSTTSCPCCRQDLWSGPPLEDAPKSSSGNSNNIGNNNNNNSSTSENRRTTSTFPTSSTDNDNDDDNDDDERQQWRPQKPALQVASIRTAQA